MTTYKVREGCIYYAPDGDIHAGGKVSDTCPSFQQQLDKLEPASRSASKKESPKVEGKTENKKEGSGDKE